MIGACRECDVDRRPFGFFAQRLSGFFERQQFGQWRFVRVGHGSEHTLCTLLSDGKRRIANERFRPGGVFPNTRVEG
ncbi:hypothetical protein MnTg02_01342 [bacterium MnTg02]|nr:hypothetical protein MnTg02_01342 [bacterium MnTg02]